MKCFAILGRRLFYFWPSHAIMKWTRRVRFLLHVNRLVAVADRTDEITQLAADPVCVCVVMTTRGQNRQNSAKSDCKFNDVLYQCLTGRLSAVCEEIPRLQQDWAIQKLKSESSWMSPKSFQFHPLISRPFIRQQSSIRGKVFCLKLSKALAYPGSIVCVIYINHCSWFE